MVKTFNMVLAVAAAIAMTVVMWIHVQRIEAEAAGGSFVGLGCKDGEGVVVPVQCSFQCTLPNSSLNHIQVRVRCEF